MNIKTPSLLAMLKAGVHFGHKNSKWHPNMEPYIFTTKNSVHIINLEATQKKLEEALKVLADLASQNKTILFVGTKSQATSLVEKYAILCDMPYVVNRWLGGLLTNFSHVAQVPQKLTRLKKDRESGELKKYTKKEQLEFDREIERLDYLVGGIETMTKKPDMVFLVDLVKEKTALREAQQMGIPVTALCDTNTDPRAVDYPIPGNDDATKSIKLMMQAVAEAVNEGKKNPQVEEKITK